MSTYIAIALSQAPDAQSAATQAAHDIKSQLDLNQADLVLVLTSGAYVENQVIDIIQSILKPEHLIGTSTAGLILGDAIFSRGIALLAIYSDEIKLSVASCNGLINKDMRKAGFELGRQLSSSFKGHQREACLLFTDPLFQKDMQFIRGAQEVLGSGFPLFGAIGGVDSRLKKDCQFFQKQLLSQSAVALLMGGINIGVGSKHGFKPLGKPRTITKSENGIIKTIDGKAAFRIYEEYLGPEADKIRKGTFSLHSLLYPLGIYMEAQGQYLLKNAVDILPDGSIVCQGEVPEGAEVHLMIGGRESCRKSAIDAALQVKEALGGRQAKLIIIIESAARNKILKNGSSAEIQAVRDVLGYTTPVIGLYTWGEIAPFGPGHGIDNTHMQSESITILGLE